MKKLLIITLILFSTNAIAQAVTPAEQQEAGRALDTLQRKEESATQEWLRKKEQELRERERRKIEVPQPEFKELKKGQCFQIDTIELQAVTILSKKEQQKLIDPYLGTCIDLATINQLMREITNLYINKGYVTTRVAIPQQNMKSGTLQLLIVEGKIEDIILNENSIRDRMQIMTVFPFTKGKLLNLRDIEQAVDQLNRISSNNFTMQIIAGNKNGYSIVVLKNELGKRNHLSFGFDNSGQNDTGKRKGRVSFERDNLIGINDIWSFHYNKDTAADSGQRGSEVYSLGTSIPLGYWTFSGDYSHSEYKLPFETSIANTIESSGQTESGNINANRVIWRGKDTKSSIDIGLNHKNILSKTNGNENTNSSTRAMTILKTSIDHTLRKWNSIFYNKIGYERGLSWLGARDDAPDINSSQQRAQFDKFTLYSSAYKPFQVKGQQFNYRTNISGQYGIDRLFASERIIVGDQYSVRGFKQSSLSGDKGAYIRNELAWNAPQFSENEYVNNFVGNIQPYAGLDYGFAYVRGGKAVEQGQQTGHISGWAMGVRNNSKWLNFDLTYAEAINAPSTITKPDYEVYFTVGSKVEF